jgi:biotin transport system substrate-specific component
LAAGPRPGSTVLADLLPTVALRDAVLVLAGALLTVLGAQIAIPVPGSPAPITGQTFAVVVAGAALGARRGALSQLLYVVAGFALPVYADGAHGIDVIWGATGGYIIAFPIAAGVMGLFAERGLDRKVPTAFLAFVLTQLIIFGIGVPWLKVSASLDWATAIHSGFTIFIVGGIVKAAAAGLVIPSAWRSVKRFDLR